MKELPLQCPVLPEQAKKFNLSFINVPHKNERQHESSMTLFSQLIQHELVCNIDSKENGLAVTLFIKQPHLIKNQLLSILPACQLYRKEVGYSFESSINALLVLNGVATINKFCYSKSLEDCGMKEKEILSCLRQAQENAKSNRRELWEFGDYLEYE